MIKVTFLIDNSEYCKYKEIAYDAFNDFVEHNKIKDKIYKKGTRKVWFNKTQWKHGSYLIDNLQAESVPLTVMGE